MTTVAAVGKLASQLTYKTPRALGTYVFLAKPRPNKKGEDQYSIGLVFPKGANLDPLRKAIMAVAAEKFGPKSEALMRIGKLKNPLRDGNEKYIEDEEKFKVYKDCFFMNAKSDTMIGIVNTSNERISAGEVYSGCYFHAAIRFYAFDSDGNKGVGCGLSGLMLVHKGERIDGRESVEKIFETFEADTDNLPEASADDGLGDAF